MNHAMAGRHSNRWICTLHLSVVVRQIAAVVAVALCGAGTAVADLDWASGNWGIDVTSSGTPGSPLTGVSWPGGGTTGNDLQVYYQFTGGDVRQLGSVLTDGFWRLVTREGRFGPSFRNFSYFGSTDLHRDTSAATGFEVVGVTPAGGLELTLDYENDDPDAGHQFDIHAEVRFDIPATGQTSVVTTITVTNDSGNAVVPYWQGHRDLTEQWELAGYSSMYVADNLTGGLPPWYDGLDPAHQYVGNTSDADPLNDGFSQNGQIFVPTHDSANIMANDVDVPLDHDMPYVVVPGLEWYHELVLLDQPSRSVSLNTLYEPEVCHQVELLWAEGLIGSLDDFKWAVTYDRNDTNMVDGDNVQVKLGMDDAVNAWPAGASQTVRLRLTVGEPNLSGDYNGDGSVDAADYTVWRDLLGSTGNLAADGDGSGTVDEADYTVWKMHFGDTAGSGSLTAAAVPEPATLMMFLAGMLVFCSRQRAAGDYDSMPRKTEILAP